MMPANISQNKIKCMIIYVSKTQTKTHTKVRGKKKEIHFIVKRDHCVFGWWTGETKDRKT